MITTSGPTPGLSTGDDVDNSGFGDDAQVTQAHVGSPLLYNVNAFDSVTAALSSTAVHDGDIIRVLSGNYSDHAVVNKQVTLLAGTPASFGGGAIDKSTIAGTDPSRDPSGSPVRETVYVTSSRSVHRLRTRRVHQGLLPSATRPPAAARASSCKPARPTPPSRTTSSHGTSTAWTCRATTRVLIPPSSAETTSFRTTVPAPTAARASTSITARPTSASTTTRCSRTITPAPPSPLGSWSQAGANATIQNNIIARSTVGIRLLSGGSATILANDFNASGAQPVNATDLLLESDAGAGTTAGATGQVNTFTASGPYIDDRSPNGVTAIHNLFGGVDPASMVLSSLYGLEDRIIHGVDIAGAGLVRVRSQEVFVTPNSHVAPSSTTASIQRGIDVAASDDTVYVESGSYVNNLTINKPLHLVGDGSSLVTVVPAVSNVLPSAGGSLPAGASNMVLIQASNVEVTGFTFDGNNPALAGETVGGGDVDARNGIIEDFNAGVFDNTNVHDNIVQNIWLRGIYASSGGSGFKVDNNTVSNVRGSAQSIAIFNFGGAGEIKGNQVSQANDAIATNWSRGTLIQSNQVTNSGTGIHSDNNGGSGGTADQIENNTVTNGTANSLWHFRICELPADHGSRQYDHGRELRRRRLGPRHGDRQSRHIRWEHDHAHDGTSRKLRLLRDNEHVGLGFRRRPRGPHE